MAEPGDAGPGIERAVGTGGGLGPRKRLRRRQIFRLRQFVAILQRAQIAVEPNRLGVEPGDLHLRGVMRLFRFVVRGGDRGQPRLVRAAAAGQPLA